MIAKKHYIKIINNIQNNKPLVIDTRFMDNTYIYNVSKFIKTHNNFSYLSIKDKTELNFEENAYKQLFNSLSHCNSSQTFKFKCIYHNYLYINDLIYMLKNNTSSKNLYIKYYYIKPYELKELFDAIKNNSLIKISLYIFYKNLNPKLFNPEYFIINELTNYNNLQKICIKGTFLGSKNVYKKLNLLLNNLNNLKSFKIFNCNDGCIIDRNKYNKLIYHKLIENNTIKKLIINTQSQELISYILSCCKNIRHLIIINFNKITLNNKLINCIISSNLTKLYIFYILENKN